MNRPVNTIAVLYPGELGARVAAALSAVGATVITTLHGRGAGTRRRCASCGIAERPTLLQVVREADVVLSFVPPAAAEAVARDYAALAHLAPPDAVFVDCNSIGAALARNLGERVERAGRSFVDGAVNGLASRFSDGGTVFLSGARAVEIGRLFEGVTRVQVLGPEVGAASTMKMLLSGISKGVCALFVELAIAAQRHGMLAEMLDVSSQIYPEIGSLVRRMLPTYVQHAARRVEEMRQLESTLRDVGTEPVVTEAVRCLHERLAQAAWHDAGSSDLAALVRVLSKGSSQPAKALRDCAEAAAAPAFLRSEDNGR
jgi:3-hydroxyisobutyrate dehydrogenase-like beta-hydroxyacid dehydrogenase